MRQSRVFFFSTNTDVDVKVEVCEAPNIMTESLNDKYLGLPAMVGADRSDCFQSFDRQSDDQDKWVEGEDVEYGWKGNSD